MKKEYMQKRDFILKADEGVAYRKNKDSAVKNEEGNADIQMDTHSPDKELLEYIPFCNDIILLNIVENNRK
jgi:hypothetical protein